MRSGTCPKCSGTEVFAARNGLGLGDGYRVGIRPNLEPDFRGAARPHLTSDVWAYVCAGCGYTETYVHDAAAIDFIRRTWVAVQPPAAD